MEIKHARYRLWGRRLFPDQTEIDTYIDFVRFWFGLDKKFLAIDGGGENYNTDVTRIFLSRLFVFENFLPAHIWADPNKKFSNLLDELSDSYEKECTTNDFFIAAGNDIEGIDEIQNYKTIAKWMASLNVSRSLDISARAKGRERWWAQYFPPYSEEMLSHEIFIDEQPGDKKSGEKRRPFKKIEKPKYILTGRSGEVLYWLFSTLSSDVKNELSGVLGDFYCGKNPYTVVFRLMDKFVNFLFYDTTDSEEVVVRSMILDLIDENHKDDFEKLLIDLKNESSNAREDHTFPTDFCEDEKVIYSRWCIGLKNIFAASNSRDVAVLRASKYLVWTNIKYLMVRARKNLLDSEKEQISLSSLNPEILVSFPGVDALQALVQKSRICFNEIHRSIESAHHIEVQKMVKEEKFEVNEDSQRQNFNAEHGSYLTRRGKKLGVIYPPGSGGRHFFTINEAFLDVLVAANFPQDAGDIIEFSDLLENFRLNEGLIFDLNGLKEGNSLKNIVKEETSGFELNVRILKDKIRNLGILQEASDSNAYVLKPSKSGSVKKDNCGDE